MMFEVTNHAPGPRTFQCASSVKDGAPDTITLAPGAVRTLDLIDVEHPVLKAWASTGEVVFVEVSPLSPAKAKG